MHATLPLLEESDFPPLIRTQLKTLQINLGYICNQKCLHCHVNAGPSRTESMDKKTIESILSFIDENKITTIDLTGGAPELNPYFKMLVSTVTNMGVQVIDRCNLTILTEPHQHDLADFLAINKVEVMASLPCYQESNVNKQRGSGVFEKSIKGLKILNLCGYGSTDSGLTLNLVYNPIGPHLPPSQEQLEYDYKKELQSKYGIVFNRLYTIANMPIQRFGSTLISKNQFGAYMQLLRKSYNSEILDSVMCRSLISIDWQGYVYDCDFNQMLNLPLGATQKSNVHITDLRNFCFTGSPITVKDHCYGCTAGQGSSCGGALA